MCVMALVSKRDYYGYELVETISKNIEMSEGSIYPILRRMTQEKYFETYIVESTEGPPRKYYRITKLGREHTKLLLRSWNKFNDGVNEVIGGTHE